MESAMVIVSFYNARPTGPLVALLDQLEAIRKVKLPCSSCT